MLQQSPALIELLAGLVLSTVLLKLQSHWEMGLMQPQRMLLEDRGPIGPQYEPQFDIQDWAEAQPDSPTPGYSQIDDDVIMCVFHIFSLLPALVWAVSAVSTAMLLVLRPISRPILSSSFVVSSSSFLHLDEIVWTSQELHGLCSCTLHEYP